MRQAEEAGPGDPAGRLLHRLRAQGGRSLAVGGNTRVPLDDPDAVLVVCSGSVDVFAVRIEDDHTPGARHHVGRVDAGQALFGNASPPAGDSLRMVAVAATDTSWLEVPTALFAALVHDPRYTDAVVSLLEGWVTLLSTAAVAQALPPTESTVLAAGHELRLDHHELVRAEARPVWVLPTDATLRFLADSDLPLPPGHQLFPLTSRSWLAAAGGATTVVGLDTRQVLVEDESLSALRGFHAAVLSALASDLARASSARREGLRRSAETDRVLAREAVLRLGAVLDRTPQAGTGEVGDGALLQACRLVGKGIGVRLRRPEGSPGTARDPLDEISRASGVRMRRVALSDDWWRRDCGPLLAFRGEERHPVALLPKGTSAYLLVDPADGTRQRVTAQTAAGLAPEGYTFYPPFPDRPLTAKDLVAYGLRGLRADLVRVLLTGVAGGLLGALVPIAAKQVVDVAIPQAHQGLTLAIVLGLVIAAASAMLFEIIRQFAVLRIQTRLDAGVQAAIWDRLLSLPAQFFRGYSSGDLAVRAMGINTISQMVTGATLASLLSGVFSVFSIGVIFFYDANLGLIAAGMAAVIVVATLLGGLLQLRHQRRETELIGLVSSLVLQLLDGIAKIRVAGAEMRAFALWAGLYSRQKAEAARAQSAANAVLVFNSAAVVLSSMVVFAVVAFSLGTSVTTGEFVAFNTAFTQFLVASAGITTGFTTILQAAPFYERAKPILSASPEVDTQKPDPGELRGRVELNHVTFRYDPDGPLVLDDVSIHAEPGEFVAVVGPSGAGKSSLFRHLLGFEEALTGTVYYDDHDLSRINVQAVRRQMGVVLQNNRLMSGTLFQNIAGVAPLTMEQVWEAARMAGLDADIDAMPMKMFTVLGEGASAISGGQRQRLAIARALAAKPRILLFDEATSALDNRTQAIVSDSLSRLEVTRIVIAHRLSTIVDADRIYVLQAGRVVQSGTYASLMEQDGPFRDLAARQVA